MKDAKNTPAQAVAKAKGPSPAQVTLNKECELRPAKGATKNRKRIGRGPGSGQGNTAGRGENGQKSRSGSGIRSWFEGNQMPLVRRIPKRGFNNIFRTEYQVINVASLEKFADGETVTLETLYAKGTVSKKDVPVKLLANGDCTRKLTVKVAAASKAAVEKVAQAGGKLELIAAPALQRDKKGKMIKKSERAKAKA